MKNRSVIFFRLSIVFAVAAAMFSLVCFARITKTEHDIDCIRADIAESENDIILMRVKEETVLSVKEIELYAKNKLHMIPVCAESIRYIEIAD